MFGMVEGSRQTGRPKIQWVDDIKRMDGKIRVPAGEDGREKEELVTNIMHQRPNRLRTNI